MIQGIDLPVALRNRPTKRIEFLVGQRRQTFKVVDLLVPDGNLPVTALDDLIQRADLRVPVRSHRAERFELLFACLGYAFQGP